jgi:Cft2 family RNA processing exonuclease
LGDLRLYNRTSSGGVIVAKDIMSIHDMELQLLKRLIISREAAKIIPAHGVDIRLTDLLGKLEMMLRQKLVEPLH